MRVVIDTHVFLERIVPREYELYSALIEKHDATVVVNRKMVNEYRGRAWSHGYRALDIYITLRELEDEGKMHWKGMSACERITVSNEEIKKDVHIIQLALATNAKYVITEDWTDLLNYRSKIKREYDVEILTPNQYLMGVNEDLHA